MDFSIEEYSEEINLTIIEDGDLLEFSIEEVVEEVDITIEEYNGVDGIGLKGDKPDHEWNGTQLRFENPDDTWGEYVDLKGEDGLSGIQSVQAGDNITIDNTDPLNPIISAEEGGTIVTKTSDLTNDGEDGTNPFISLNEVPVIDLSPYALKATTVNGYGITDAYTKTEVNNFLTNKADLDGNGKVPLTQINDALIGNVNYKGIYNGTIVTASPDATLVGNPLPTASAHVGWYFIATGSFTNGGISYTTGDWMLSNGTTYDKIDNTDAVSSVNGQTGVVTLTKSDVGLGNVDNTSDADKNIAIATLTNKIIDGGTY